MLDFYLIKDEHPKPDYPEQESLEFVGSIAFKTYWNLRKKDVIDKRFDYFSDFRWSFQVVAFMLNEKPAEMDTDLAPFYAILTKALKAKCGLIAYGD